MLVRRLRQLVRNKQIATINVTASARPEAPQYLAEAPYGRASAQALRHAEAQIPVFDGTGWHRQRRGV